MKIIIAVITVLLFITGCEEIMPDNVKISESGYTITLAKGEKLVNVSATRAKPYIVTRKMRKDEKAETYTFYNPIDKNITYSYKIIEQDE